MTGYENTTTGYNFVLVKNPEVKKVKINAIISTGSPLLGGFCSPTTGTESLSSLSIIVIYCTNLCHFFQVKNWVKELRKMLGNDIALCIAGNKIDLEKERHVPVEEAEE